MGNTPKLKLCDAVECGKIPLTLQILERFPGILDEPFNSETKMNPIVMATWRGNLEMVKALVEKGANVDVMVNGGHRPVFWCAIRNRQECLKYFLENTKADIFRADMLGHTPLDHAITNGNYKCAIYLKRKGLYPKSLEFYELEQGRFFQAEIDFENFLRFLEADEDDCEELFIKVIPEHQKYKDPVYDPRETWGEWAYRVKDFKEPVQVEREELPENLRPENTGNTGKFRTLYYGSQIKRSKTTATKDSEINENKIDVDIGRIYIKKPVNVGHVAVDNSIQKLVIDNNTERVKESLVINNDPSIKEKVEMTNDEKNFFGDDGIDKGDVVDHNDKLEQSKIEDEFFGADANGDEVDANDMLQQSQMENDFFESQGDQKPIDLDVDIQIEAERKKSLGDEFKNSED